MIINTCQSYDCRTDAKSVAKTLKNKYEFGKNLNQSKRQDILDRLDAYREQLTGNDNLLI